MEIITPKRELSMEELTSMAESVRQEDAPKEAVAPLAEPAKEATKEEAPAPKANKSAKEETPKPESGTDKNQHQEEIEEELPENVKKRIASEAKKQAFFQSKVDHAISARKAAQAEAEKLTGKPGSEPAPKTEPAKNERPQRPDLATFDGDLAAYKAAVAKADDEIEKWMEARTRETVQKEFTEQQAKLAQKKEWEVATAKHGADFPQLMDTLAANTPVEIQRAISALDDWSTVAVHLAKNEEERTALVEEFKTSPHRAIAKLGKLEDRLKPEAVKPAAEPVKEPAKEPVLPKPLKAVGGDAPGSNGRVDLNKASMPEFLNEIERMVKAH